MKETKKKGKKSRVNEGKEKKRGKENLKNKKEKKFCFLPKWYDKKEIKIKELSNDDILVFQAIDGILVLACLGLILDRDLTGRNDHQWILDSDRWCLIQYHGKIQCNTFGN